jgi:peptide/nickel transport system permease protein
MYRLYVLKRIGYGVILYVIMIFTFSLIFNVKKQEIQTMDIQEQVKVEAQAVSRSMTAEQRTKYREDLLVRRMHEAGLDKPMLFRIMNETYKTLVFDFGDTKSYKPNGETNVNVLIMDAVPNTLTLFLSEVVLVILLGVPLGLKMAQKPNKLLDRSVSTITMITAGMPSWWLGMSMIFLFIYQVPIFPGLAERHEELEGAAAFGFQLYKLALPLITLVLLSVWSNAYLTRNIVLGNLQEDFIMAARARGIPERKVLYGHTLRTSMPAIVTISVISLFGAISGNLIFEGIFEWPGLGLLYWRALEANENSLLLGLLAVTTIINMVGYIMLDIIYGFLDPRIKVGGKA